MLELVEQLPLDVLVLLLERGLQGVDVPGPRPVHADRALVVRVGQAHHLGTRLNNVE